MRRMSTKDMQGFHVMCWKYADAHENEWPESLKEVIEWGNKNREGLERFEALLSVKDPENELGFVYIKPGLNYLDFMSSSGRNQEQVLVLYQVFNEWPEAGIWVTYLDGHVKLEINEPRFQEILELSKSREY